MVTLIDTTKEHPDNPSLSPHTVGEDGLPKAKVPPKAAPLLSNLSVNGVSIPEAEVLQEVQNHSADTPGQALEAAARALVVRRERT